MPNGKHVFLQVLDNVHRRQDFAGGVGGAGIGAAAAHCAGVAVQQLLPGEVLDSSRAEPLGILQVDGRHGAARFEGAEIGVQGGADHVDVLGRGDVDAEAQDDAQVHPPENCVERRGGCSADAHAGEGVGQDATGQHRGLGALAAGSHVEGVDQQGGNHQARGQSHHNDGVDVAGQVKTEAVGFGGPPPHQHPRQDAQDQDGVQVEIDAVDLDAGGSKQQFRECECQIDPT